jgi:hypothetical protein
VAQPSPRTSVGLLARTAPVTRPEPAELAELRQVLAAGAGRLEHRVVGHSVDGLPIDAIALGSRDPSMPAVGFFGGVHGLERIGAQVVISWLASLVQRLRWDATLERELERVRLVFVPVVNPGGLVRGTRANPNGVDLMRNAPVDCDEPAPWLVGGQRISASLPWYRGRAGAPMEPEGAALCAVVREELLARPFAIALDCHSGFGSVDRIWFPFAHTTRPIEHLPEVHALAEIFEQAHAHHRYVIEPQSRHYLAHGDLWDHLYRDSCARPGRVLLPLTLEMGSWTWVKKNPRQLFTRHGIFNPVIGHRVERVLRRHVPWLDFLVRAAASHARWRPQGAARDRQLTRAVERWYRARA